MASSRISKFNHLELNEDVSCQADEAITEPDCMNIFYNLLKTKKKDSNEIYGTVLDCELNSDGEINPISILEDERKGPILVHKNFSVAQSVPFDTEDANVFLNGGKAPMRSKGFPAAVWFCSTVLQCEVKNHLGVYDHRLGYKGRFGQQHLCAHQGRDQKYLLSVHRCLDSGADLGAHRGG